MANIIGGTNGGVTAANFNVDVTEWAATINADSDEYRALGSEWKTTGLSGFMLSGTFSGKVQYNASSTAPISVTPSEWKSISFTLTAEDGCTYTFTGNMTSAGIDRVAGFSTGTFSFISTGAVSRSWDETP